MRAVQPTGVPQRSFSSTTSPLKLYDALITKGDITDDPQQRVVVGELDNLSRLLTHYSPVPAKRSGGGAPPPPSSSGGGLFGGLFGGGAPKPAVPTKPVEVRLTPSVKGLYIFGSCGTGKTFLMDLFYDGVPVRQKQRIHFHEWMIGVHDKLHQLAKAGASVKEKANTVWNAEAATAQRLALKENKSAAPGPGADDLIVKVAEEMMREAWLICFDEFQVTHISDAIIMKRLFSILFERGCVVITTSNRPPEDLYLNGLNRPLFLPFIPLLRDCCDVLDINSKVDYRLITETEEEDRRVYIYPNGKEEFKLLERKFYRITGGELLSGAQVEAQGRRIAVPKAGVNSNVAWFRFQDLCDKALGSADYLAVANAFHTVFVSDIPKLTLQERDQVRRFITMIDAFYERHTKLVCTAADNPLTLFHVSEEDKESSTADEIFAWDRTASRLIEMQSKQYLSESSRMMDGEQFLNQFSLNSLAEEDIHELWRRYDGDDSGEIDQSELRVMLEDMLEVQKGHRNVSDEVFQCSLEAMDTDGNGMISREEFSDYMKDYTRVSSNMRL